MYKKTKDLFYNEILISSDCSIYNENLPVFGPWAWVGQKGYEWGRGFPAQKSEYDYVKCCIHKIPDVLWQNVCVRPLRLWLGGLGIFQSKNPETCKVQHKF